MKRGWEAVRLLRAATFSGPSVFIPTLLYSLLLNALDNTVRQETPLLYRFLFVLVVHVTVYSTVKFGRSYFFPPGEGRFQLLQIAGILVFSAVFRGYLMHYFSEGMDMYKEDNLGFRIANSVQNFPVAFAVCGVATQAYLEWQARRDKLLVDNSRLRRLIEEATVLARVEHQRLVDTVTGQLLRFVREVERSKPTEIISNLRNGIASIVRPLTKEVEQIEFVEREAPRRHNSITFDQVMRGVVNTRPFEPLLMPLVVIWVGTPFIVNAFGPQGLAPYILAVALVGFSTYALFQKIIEKLNLNWVLVWFLVAAAAVFSAVFECVSIVYVLHRYQGTQSLGIALIVMNVIWALMFTATSGIIRQLQLSEAALRESQAQLTWNLARETEIQRQRSRSLAIALHGPVQTAVGASIIRLENAALHGEITQDLIDEVSELIYESLEQLQEKHGPIDLDEVCSELKETWSGICEIENRSTPEDRALASQDPVTLRLIAEIVPELTFNAIKHGEANRVSVEIGKITERTLELTVMDNGKSFATDGRATGLGLRHLNESAIRVTRETIDGENLTRILLPFDNSPPPRKGGGVA